MSLSTVWKHWFCVNFHKKSFRTFPRLYIPNDKLYRFLVMNIFTDILSFNGFDTAFCYVIFTKLQICKSNSTAIEIHNALKLMYCCTESGQQKTNSLKVCNSCEERRFLREIRALLWSMLKEYSNLWFS